MSICKVFAKKIIKGLEEGKLFLGHATQRYNVQFGMMIVLFNARNRSYKINLVQKKKNYYLLIQYITLDSNTIYYDLNRSNAPIKNLWHILSLCVRNGSIVLALELKIISIILIYFWWYLMIKWDQFFYLFDAFLLISTKLLK